ncbi:MAG: glutamine--fructose-6-phosphate transaminase (isomerizing), partial [Planctomycetota bacterium]
MCGIVAYVGNKQAAPLLVEGLKRLEYRGYDSAGVAITTPQGVEYARSVGRVSVLEELINADPRKYDGTLGIAHTRWATHGEPTEANAHPHTGTTASGHTISLVHNGIIENYRALRTYLEGKGHVFTSQTDTEVLAKLIAELYQPAPGSDTPGSDDFDGAALESAVQTALREVTGAYAIAVTCTREPHTLVAARKGSPLMIGVAENAYVVASDPSAIVAHTTQAITLDDYQVARLCAGPVDGWGDDAGIDIAAAKATGKPWAVDFRTTTIDNVEVTQQVSELEIDLQEIELGGYEHFMLKEIMEQPDSIRTCLTGRIDTREGQIVLGGLSNLSRELVRAKRVILSAQGTAYHAGLIGEYLFEDLAKMPSVAHYASEFRYRNPIIEEGSVIISISQSGETADTLAALEEAKSRGALALGAVNVVGSTMSRETDAGVYLRVGPEIGVASTKAFVGQVAVLTMMALYVGRRRYLSPDTISDYLQQLEQVPDHIAEIVKQSDLIRDAVAQVV